MSSKRTIKITRFIATAVLALMSLFSASSIAQTEKIVVVIPMGGEDAISHPIATTFTNSIGMQFNELPAGSFTMGSPIAEPGRFTNEVEHTVTLSKPFQMQTTEVTNAQWDAVISTPLTLLNPSTSHSEAEYPVETVSWFDAVFFANRLSISEGKSSCYTFTDVTGTPGIDLTIATVTMNENCTGYSLPTEAQWEYAARAGTTKAYANPIGFDDSDVETGTGFNGNMHAMGWYYYNRSMENSSAVAAYEDGTKPVAKKQANGWGLYDMHGNVWESVWDRYAAYSGDATDPSGPASGSNRVIRGGSWSSSAWSVRSALRGNNSPGSRGSGLGFRLVLPSG